ncbi:hypothetical protein AAY473_001201, partial [Plecturocebus cupreus]
MCGPLSKHLENHPDTGGQVPGRDACAQMSCNEPVLDRELRVFSVSRWRETDVLLLRQPRLVWPSNIPARVPSESKIKVKKKRFNELKKIRAKEITDRVLKEIKRNMSHKYKISIKGTKRGRVQCLMPHFRRPRQADHLRARVQEQPGQHGETLISSKNTKISWLWRHVPVIPATLEAEAGESLEPRRQRSFFLENFTLVVQAGVQWRNLGSPQSLPPGFKWRWVDHLRPGVPHQPGQHGNTLSLLKIQKLARCGDKHQSQLLRRPRQENHPGGGGSHGSRAEAGGSRSQEIEIILANM